MLMKTLLAAELLNSAVEYLADLVRLEAHHRVARAKGCGAAVAFVLSSASALIILLLCYSISIDLLWTLRYYLIYSLPIFLVSEQSEESA